MDQTVEKTMDRLSELLERATKAAQDLEVKDRLSDAVSALRRTRVTQEEETGVERAQPPQPCPFVLVVRVAQRVVVLV